MNEMQTAAIQAQPSPVEEAYKGKLIVVEQVYHQRYGASPSSSESRYIKELDSEEQSYRREVKVGQHWHELDTGWLKESSLIEIENTEGNFTLVNPTEAQRAESRERVLEISFDNREAAIEVHPKESARFQPANLKSIWVRCHKGECRVTINVYPK